MEPYSELDERAGLVQIWSQMGYPIVKWIVSLGAIASLAASMFGSMFPMPRIAYAMAKDGLIFRIFAAMNSRGVPACANFWLSIIAALCALFFSLEVLVEMMSIGTLLAYSLVDACVLILRYQQRSQPTFIELMQSKEVKTDFTKKKKIIQYLSCLQDQVVVRDICFGIDIQSPMEEFAKNEESEKELGIIETFKKFMHGTHSAQMVNV